MLGTGGAIGGAGAGGVIAGAGGAGAGGVIAGAGGAGAGGADAGESPVDAPVVVDLAPDVPTLKSPGEPCTNKGECATAACVDGFCCENACTGPCSACAAAQTGRQNGVCAPAVGRRCATRCATSMGAPAVFENVCNDKGECEPTSRLVERCVAPPNECQRVFCAETAGTGRCVPVMGCDVGECCCSSNNGKRCVQVGKCPGPQPLCL
jgi:hypothetical protein